MRYKKIMLVSLVLLAILTIGAVSAADENVTSEELTVEEDSIIESVDAVNSNNLAIEEDSIGDTQQTIGDEKEDVSLKESQDSEVLNGKNVTMSFNMPTDIPISDDFSLDDWISFDGDEEDITGNVTFYIDNAQIKQMNAKYPIISLNSNDFKGLSYGSHTWELNYSGNTYYNPSSINGTFVYAVRNVTMSFDMPTEIDSSDDFILHTFVGFDGAVWDVTGTVTLYIDNVTCTQVNAEDPMIFLDSSDFKGYGLSYGPHTWELKYSGDSNYNPSSINGTFIYTYMRVDFPNIAPGESFCVILPEDCKGVITLYINGTYVSETDYAPEEDGNFFIPVKGLTSYGNYTYKVVHSKDTKYPGATTNGTFEYILFDAFLDLDVDYGQSANLGVPFPDDITGNVEIYVNNKLYKTVAASEWLQLKISELNIGDNNITVKYLGSAKYPKFTWSGITTATPKINAKNTVACTDQLEVSLILPNNATGKLIATINGKEVGQSGFINGKALIKLPKLSMNQTNNLKAWYNGTDYDVEAKEIKITVTPKIVLPDFNAGRPYVSVEFPSNATGNLRILLNGKDLDVDFKNGKAQVDLLSKIVSANRYYEIRIKYSGNYPSFDKVYSIYVKKIIPDIKVILPDKVMAGRPINVVFILPSDATGTVELLEDEVYDTIVSKGKVTVKGFEFSEAGTFTVGYEFHGDKKYDGVSGNFTVKVTKGKITGSALTMTYSDGSAFKVRLFDTSGKAVGSGKLVTFKINGKKVASAKTNKNGYASFKPKKTPGSYKITAIALGAKITKTLKVKQILKLKTIKIKKSAKKLVLKATLAKVKGKYLKGKLITFKFNGKTYKVKTNKKGVAQKTFNKKFIKKLKVGKKIKYQATYLKVTIKKSAKVKK